MKKLLITIFILSFLLFSGCWDVLNLDLNDNNNMLKYTIDNIPENIIDANNNFSLELFKTINTNEGDSNIFISPVSVSFALGMTMNGADRNTYEEMKNTLDFADLDIEKINKSYLTLIDELYNVSEGVEFNLANSIWYSDKFSLQNEFKNLNENYFKAKMEGLDFNDVENSLDIMNSWVEEQTQGKIKNLINRIYPNDCMFLINAIYFNASWKYQFDETETEESQFYIDNENAVNCDMMNIKSKFHFVKTNDYHALELPYANENYSMLMLMPRSKNIDDFLNSINRDTIAKIQNKFEYDSINISIPKLELEYEINLNDILIEMGIEEAFDSRSANFSKMFNELQSSIWIDRVKQKSFLKVNEEGTEAAAATAVVMTLGISDEKFMNFNIPYLFFIIEKQSNTILFCGKVVNPVE
ncbi:MAG: serpin family protein [Candidatus Marinimicrobia bacterium]|nr:serpin family protein [Candidatus Neomarinimicrobiota bacterium]